MRAKHKLESFLELKKNIEHLRSFTESGHSPYDKYTWDLLGVLQQN